MFCTKHIQLASKQKMQKKKQKNAAENLCAFPRVLTKSYFSAVLTQIFSSVFLLFFLF
jgi:hypothetical protein